MIELLPMILRVPTYDNTLESLAMISYIRVPSYDSYIRVPTCDIILVSGSTYYQSVGIYDILVLLPYYPY